MRHYPVYELDQFLKGELPRWKRIGCQLHLLRCPKCRKRLAKLQTDNLLIDDLKKSLLMFKPDEKNSDK